MNTACDTCDDLTCWLEAVKNHPMLVYQFVRWLARHDLPTYAAILGKARLTQQIAFCRSWAAMLTG